MPSKPKVVLRILALLTALEALGALLAVGLSVSTYSLVKDRFGSDYPHFGEIYMALVLANVLIIGLLFVSAFLLWRLQRRGLFLLILTLGIELVYLIGLMGALLSHESAITAELMGVGLRVLILQILTAYPLMAVVLLILAYRYLGIPARAPQ